MKSKRAGVAKGVVLVTLPVALAGVVVKGARYKATQQLLQRLSTDNVRGGWSINGYLDALVARGADINAHDSRGLTPLHYAAGHTSTDLRYLLDHGALVDAQDSDGVTPLMLAVISSQSSNVRLLLRYGANPNLPMYRRGRAITALSVARMGLGQWPYLNPPDLIIMRREIIPVLKAAGAKE